MRKTPKHDREIHILYGLVEHYIRTGAPVGSSALKDALFKDLSSATLRNYFAKLESSGFLRQEHSSGGRIPTDSAFKLFAMQSLDQGSIDKKEKAFLKSRLLGETREVASYLGYAADVISEATECAAFISSPRFDQDLVQKIKLLKIDHNRCLCVVITDFGIVHTETVYTPETLSQETLGKIELYFAARIENRAVPDIDQATETFAKQLYSEIMLRHISGYANFHADDLHKTGFSRMLAYPELQDATTLASGLAIFENPNEMRRLTREARELGDLKFWIGTDLGTSTECAVIAIPYCIGGKPAGAVAILGPKRLPYAKLFAMLQEAAENISENLTQNLIKFQISFREPTPAPSTHLEQQSQMVLEDRRREWINE
ncbi:MAG: heat-inducible transcriptional repressor HrcA [Simkaniaceae bacterium]|nr:heat-inducible transcriptional repressor HrcA [Simkaniaceae bacterium]